MRHTRESIIALIDECRKRGTRIDLSKQDLSGLDLRWVELRWANLQEANLRWANMEGANMKGIDLQGAKLDFVGGLSCNTIGITAGKRLVSQLLYHLCRMNIRDCPQWNQLRNDERVIELANQSHVIDDYDMPEIEQTKEEEG